MSLRRVDLWLACLTLLALVGGCGESDPLGRKAISGTVKLNGASIENGNIGFQPTEQGTTSSGTVIAAGKYSIPSEKGLPVGKYRVTINAPKPGTGTAAPKDVMPGDPLPVAQEMIPPEWNTNSDQFIDVKASGPFVFDFDVKPKGK